MAGTVKDVKDFFGEKNTAKFTEEWKQLTDQDKEQLKEGIGNGSLNY